MQELTKKVLIDGKIFNNFCKKIFQLITKAYPQNYETINYLKKFGVKKIKFIGNLKFSEEKKKNDNIKFLKNQLKNKKFGLLQVHIIMKKFFVQKFICNLRKKLKIF